MIEWYLSMWEACWFYWSSVPLGQKTTVTNLIFLGWVLLHALPPYLLLRGQASR